MRSAVVTLSLVLGLASCTSAAPAPAPARADTPVIPITPAALCTATNGPYGSAGVGRGGYLLTTDEWNSSANLCVSSDGDADFTITSSALTEATNTPNRGAPGAYPRIESQPKVGQLPMPVATMGDVLTSWNTRTVATGRYDVAYDIWYADNAAGCGGATTPHELMIWLDELGGPAPQGSRLGGGGYQVTLGGRAYQVYGYQEASGHQVISYVMASPTNAVHDLNLRAITADAVVRGYVPAGGELCSVQAGFEIWTGGAGLTTDSFFYRPATGLPSGNLTSGVPGKCLDGGANVPKPSAYSLPADIWDCAETANQTFTVGNDGTIHALGKCLDVVHSGTTNGTPVDLYPCNGSGAQVWAVDGKGLVNPQSGLCLDVPGASTANGTQLVLWTCGQSGQDWRLPYRGQSIWSSFTNRATGSCLSGGVAGTGSVDLRSCAATFSPTQNWELVDDGTLRFSDGSCLDAGTSGTDRSTVRLAPCKAGAATQQWLLSPDGSLLNPAYGRCLDDPVSTQAQGTPLDLYDCNGSGAQIWFSGA